jgi:elongation factor Ts
VGARRERWKRLCARVALDTLPRGHSSAALDRMYPHHRFVQAYTHQGRVGVLVEVGLETWMVTQRPEFTEFTRDLAMHIAGLSPDSVEALLGQAWARDPSNTVSAVVAEVCKVLGERITVTRFVRWDNEPVPPSPSPTPPRDPAVAVRLKRA